MWSPTVFAVVIVVVEGNGGQVVAEGQGEVTGSTEAGLGVRDLRRRQLLI